MITLHIQYAKPLSRCEANTAIQLPVFMKLKSLARNIENKHNQVVVSTMQKGESRVKGSCCCFRESNYEDLTDEVSLERNLKELREQVQ